MFVRKDTLTIAADWIPVASDYEMKLFVNAHEIDGKVWAALNHSGNFFTSLKFLRGLQETAPPEMSFIYVLLRKDKKYIAGYIFQSIHLSPEVLSDALAPLTKYKSLVASLSEWLTHCREQKGVRLLISGNNFVSGEHGVICAKESNSAEAFLMLSEVVKVIVNRITKPVRFSVILVKDYYTAHNNRPEVLLTKKRYHSFAVEPEMILKLDREWKTFDDYVAAMSKKYRNRTKSVLKHSSELVVEELDIETLESCIDELYPLYLKMHAKAKFRLCALTPGYFVEMKRMFPSEFVVFRYTLKGEAVGFRTYFRNGHQLEAHFIGVDYKLNKELDIYNRILYDFVADAISNGSEELLLGRTAAEIKSTIGAVRYDLNCFIRHRNGFSNQMIRPFIEHLKPSDWTPRNPFKENA